MIITFHIKTVSSSHPASWKPWIWVWQSVLGGWTGSTLSHNHFSNIRRYIICYIRKSIFKPAFEWGVCWFCQFSILFINYHHYYEYYKLIHLIYVTDTYFITSSSDDLIINKVWKAQAKQLTSSSCSFCAIGKAIHFWMEYVFIFVFTW